jgi:two-component system, NtrC family, sensor histidine kinase HydH
LTPLPFEDLPRELEERIYRFVLQLRFVIAPLPILLGGFVVTTDPALWRRIAIGAVLVSAATLVVVHVRRVRAQKRPELREILLVVGLGLHPVILFATGGVFSPVLLAMLLVCFVASTLFSRRVSGWLVSAQIAVIVLAALVEYSGLAGSLIPRSFKTAAIGAAAPVFPLIYASVGGLFFLVTREMGCRIQQTFSGLLERTVAAREQSLQMHREQLADLTLLSSEIAHELKNPLASVKGLAALLARRSQGQEPELLVVLRREVDRMQDILEEFLNLSRPLVPLNLTPVDLTGAASDVVAMHEGLSAQHEVEIDLATSDPVEVRCDARKVRQILVNLLQNALDACDQAGRIVIRVEASRDMAEVLVEDDGKGLEPAVEGRVFDAGVTSKATGFGLGLNVARGLARQHGGDVTLVARSPRGCIASLRLPRDPSLINSSEKGRGPS